ncbi:winged helix-turn-helix transcriptional regulator [Paraburkholderia sp. Ac-20336]|uniref:MarR family transcriptional regulator n=1 Tax=Burkholderiaceae TaxID=119060 RepID=UPI00141E7BDB|nr:winged helix-turn-helix transcriptional regulator [Paraburkholderia sp. Ac-20336]MBN3845998.1 winged helix-turn-helix transcriptional regulator [Paraburkholderia sp. Ac-20342]NIF54139.1 winged helix-turn-helix transcriptional regulator [Burkholderia sp. Ax-1724]NIF77750.1 winged helix-turn-helix transcriptional regulator [Paraburkholderia sp. Cy-641]
MKTQKAQQTQATPSGQRSVNAVGSTRSKLSRKDEADEMTRQIDLSRCVPAVLTAAANRVSHGASTAYRKHAGIGFVDWRIVCFLAAEGWSSGAELAQGLGLDKAAISRSLSALVKQGVVETRASYGRRSESNLTRAGTSLRTRVLRLALDREEAMLRGLTTDDKERLISMLNLISRNLIEIDGSQ